MCRTAVTNYSLTHPAIADVCFADGPIHFSKCSVSAMVDQVTDNSAP